MRPNSKIPDDTFNRSNGDRSTHSGSRKLTMLIVDDEPNVCLTLKLIFEQEGYTVTTASNANEGMRLLDREARYDVVVTDLHMEHEDSGFDLARAAKKLVPPPVVVIVTGYANVINARLALEVHVDHFAIKPIEISEFLEAVRRLAGWRSDAHQAAS